MVGLVWYLLCYVKISTIRCPLGWTGNYSAYRI